MEEGIGAYITREVIPEGMTITEAAQRLGVAHSTLSRLLNGKSSLSNNLAKKLEQIFGTDAKLLLEKQNISMTAASVPLSECDTAVARIGQRFGTRASDITSLFESPQSRTRLSVFLRILVHSTNTTITRCDFPGNEEGERPGWDGFTNASKNTAWVPRGRAVWEFSTAKSISRKVNDDYQKRSKRPDESMRKTTYIFVTTRRWPGKNEWMQKVKRDTHWKDVRVYDNSNLEEWTEQSLPAQAWLLCEEGYEGAGIVPITEYWQMWSKSCTPPLIPELFADNISLKIVENMANKLDGQHPVYISANSSEEGIAYLGALFKQESVGFQSHGDRMVVVSDEKVLQEMLRGKSDIIPVISSRKLSNLLVQQAENRPSVIVSVKGANSSKNDIALGIISREVFMNAMQKMGFEYIHAVRLSRESGRSISALRRRLLRSGTTGDEYWSKSKIKKLIPICFAGKWETNSEGDKRVLKKIGQRKRYLSLEEDMLDLFNLDDTPVQMIDNVNSVISQVDSLLLTYKYITSSFLSNYFAVVGRTLGEEDPALDLPKNERYMAALYGKSRRVSNTLRSGLSDMLLVLSAYGKDIFRDHLGFDIEQNISDTIRTILSPLTGDRLESQAPELPAYAEVAPTVVLDAFQMDIENGMEALSQVVRTEDMALFSTTPRIYIQGALEVLAWRQENFAQCAEILSKLSEIELRDNIEPKPKHSLMAIFHPVYKATNASISTRENALRTMAKMHPEICWSVCWSILNDDQTDLTSHRRPVFGEAIKCRSNDEAKKLKNVARELIEKRNTHTVESLCDFLRFSLALGDETMIGAIKNASESWSRSASNNDKAKLRGRLLNMIEVWKMVKGRKGRNRDVSLFNKVIGVAEQIFELTEPSNVIQKGTWLFRNSQDYTMKMNRSSELRKSKKRQQVIQCIFNQYGVKGLLEFVEFCEDKYSIGSSLFEFENTNAKCCNLALSMLMSKNRYNDEEYFELLDGYLFASRKINELRNIVDGLRQRLKRKQFTEFLCDLPVVGEVWSYLESEVPSLANYYWKNCRGKVVCTNDNERVTVIEKLVNVGRARLALRQAIIVRNMIPEKLLNKLLRDASMQFGEVAMNQIEELAIRDFIRDLRLSEKLNYQEVAELELMYIEVVDSKNGGVECLERVISERPNIFAQAIAILSKTRRSEDKEGNCNEESLKKQTIVRRRIRKMLSEIERIPGESDEGVVCSILLVRWIEGVRMYLKENDMEGEGDREIGKLLAKAKVGSDGVWPCEGVRDALRETLSENMKNGFVTGKLNRRGTIDVTDGGGEQHNAALQFEEWARKLDGSHWQVAKMLRDMGGLNERQGAGWDQRKRITDQIE